MASLARRNYAAREICCLRSFPSDHFRRPDRFLSNPQHWLERSTVSERPTDRLAQEKHDAAGYLSKDRFVTHPILMAGRRVLYGWPYYGWSAGYDASKHDRLYAELFEGKDPWKVYHLLKTMASSTWFTTMRFGRVSSSRDRTNNS